MTVIEEVSVSPHLQTLRDAAIGYAERGWPVIPLFGIRIDSDGARVCTCPAGPGCDHSGKHPIAGKGWQLAPRASAAEVAASWDEHPEANIGIRTGREFGMVVDIDLPKVPGGADGRDTWSKLESHFGPTPPTLTARTGSGGLHLVFSVPEDLVFGNKMLPAFIGSSGIDIRGVDTGLVVVAPSRHESGTRYEWLDFLSPVEMPDWFFMDAMTGEYSRFLFDVSWAAQRRDSGTRTMDQLRGEVNHSAMLSKQTLRLLKDGRKGKHVDQSEVVYSICLGAAAVGYDPLDLYSELVVRTNKGGNGLISRARRRGKAAAQSWFVTNWNNAQDDLDAKGAKIRSLRVEAEHTTFETLSFPDRKGNSITVRRANLQKVLLASLNIAEERRTTRPMLGKSEHLPEYTGLTTKTIRKALLGLEHLGWLWEAESHPSQASLYQFRLNPEARSKQWSTEAYDMWMRRFFPFHGA